MPFVLFERKRKPNFWAMSGLRESWELKGPPSPYYGKDTIRRLVNRLDRSMGRADASLNDYLSVSSKNQATEEMEELD